MFTHQRLNEITLKSITPAYSMTQTLQNDIWMKTIKQCYRAK